MLKTLIAASFVLIVLGAQTHASEQRACAASVRQNISSVCLGKTVQSFSPWAKGINYCPIPKKKEIPTS